MKRKIVAGMTALLFLTGCAGIPGISSTPTPTPERTRIEEAARSCVLKEGIADAGMSVTMSTSGTKSVGTTQFVRIMCILDSLNAPDWLEESINTTRALDGRQTADWDELNAFWTYHPEDGLRITVVDKRVK